MNVKPNFELKNYSIELSQDEYNALVRALRLSVGMCDMNPDFKNEIPEFQEISNLNYEFQTENRTFDDNHVEAIWN